MEETETPETDAFFSRIDIEWDMEVEFARKLERERDEARATIASLQVGLEELAKLAQNFKEERDSLTR